MKRGKVVLTPFPFTDLTGSKVRPAVIVSADSRRGLDVIIAFISSVFDPANLQPTDGLLQSSDPDFPATGLKANSVFKMDKLATVSRAIILGELGDLPPTLQAKLDDKLKLALDLK